MALSAIAIVLGVTFFIISVATGKGAMSSLVFGIGIIVANVPEGLLPTVTLALTMASKRMSKKNALIKNLESVETLGSTTVICTDKTGLSSKHWCAFVKCHAPLLFYLALFSHTPGTLTQNRISVHRIVTPNRTFGFGQGDPYPSNELKHLRRIMSLCNNATPNSSGGYTGDSTEAALLACVRDMGEGDGMEDLAAYRRLSEKPFSSATKYMITVCSAPDGGCEAYLKGAPEVVLSMCDKMRVGGEIVDLDEDWFRSTLMGMASKGERCLGLAYRPVDGGKIEENGYIFKGICGMLDPPRKEVPSALKKCRGAGIRVFMLTGDFGLTAKTIAEEIGLITKDCYQTVAGKEGCSAKDIEEGRVPTSRVVEGIELEAMSEEELSNVLDVKELVFARISPSQKLQIVKALQAKGEVVTVTGDGVNDGKSSPASLCIALELC